MVYQPADAACATPCKVVLFGTGYRVGRHEYSFLGGALARAGYLTVVLQHDLSNDAPMPSTGDIAKDRGPFWRTGELALASILKQLPSYFPAYDWTSVVLSGHSQGGDIAALFAGKNPEHVRVLFTLDNRRVPLPRGAVFPVLSLRSADQAPDPGVLPPPGSAICTLDMPQSTHDRMTDSGDNSAKDVLASAVLRFLEQGECAR